MESLQLLASHSSHSFQILHVHLNCAKCLVSKFALLIQSNGLWRRCQDTKMCVHNVYLCYKLHCKAYVALSLQCYQTPVDLQLKQIHNFITDTYSD